MRAPSLFALGALLVACGPADGAVFFTATRVNIPAFNAITDAVAVDIRDLTNIDLEDFRGQLGDPSADVDGCQAFVGGLDLGALEIPGARFDAGPVTLDGSSALGSPISFVFDGDAEAYLDNANEDTLFFPGDELVLQGAGAGVVGDFDAKVSFPADVVLLNDPVAITKGQDVAINWNEANNDAGDEIAILLNATDNFGGNQVTALCRGRDNGSLTIPGAITAFFPTGGPLNTVLVARINGDNFLVNPDGAVDDMERGREVYVQAINAVVGQVDVNE